MSAIRHQLAFGFSLMLAGALGAPALGQTSSAQEKPKPAQEKASNDTDQVARGDAAPSEEPPQGPVVPSNRKLNEYGVLPSSALNDGGIDLPVEMRVPEQYQYRRPDLQFTEGQLTGKQLPPVLTEFKVLTKEVKPGEQVRVMARVHSPYNQARDFVSLFYNQELGRAAELYVNFRADKKDKSLFRGIGKVSKYQAPGRYVVGTTIVPDAVGDRKAYWADFHKPMQEEDGSPASFEVLDHPNVDTDAPVLTGLLIETQTIRAGEGLIHYTVTATDARSGPIEAEGVWISPSGDQWIRSTLVMLGNRPGTFKGALAIPEWYEGGQWRLQQIALKDEATNVGYNFDVAEPLMANNTVEVAQDPAKVDKKPPELLAVQLSHSEATPNDTVTITALVEDELSGVEAIEGYFVSKNGADAIKFKLGMSDIDLNRPSKIPEPTVWSGTVKVKDTMEMGEWRIARLGVADRARNYFTYFDGRDELVTGITCKFIGAASADTEPTEGRK
jgi:hypothetical protein